MKMLLNCMNYLICKMHDLFGKIDIDVQLLKMAIVVKKYKLTKLQPNKKIKSNKPPCFINMIKSKIKNYIP